MRSLFRFSCVLFWPLPMIRDIDAEIRKLQRLNAKGAIADRVLESEWEKALVKKERLREGLTVDGDEKP